MFTQIIALHFFPPPFVRSLCFPLQEQECTLLAHCLHGSAQGYHCLASLSFTTSRTQPGFKKQAEYCEDTGIKMLTRTY